MTSCIVNYSGTPPRSIGEQECVFCDYAGGGSSNLSLTSFICFGSRGRSSGAAYRKEQAHRSIVDADHISRHECLGVGKGPHEVSRSLLCARTSELSQASSNARPAEQDAASALSRHCACRMGCSCSLASAIPLQSADCYCPITAVVSRISHDLRRKRCSMHTSLRDPEADSAD